MDDPDFAHCAQILREADYSKYIACLYLPESLRQSAFCLYAFDTQIAKINQLVSEPMMGEIRIQWWRDVISGKNSPKGNPVAQALMETINKSNLPTPILDRYLNTRIFDLYNDPIPDKFALETYLGETQSSVFRLLSLCVDLPNNDEKTISDACGHSGVFLGIVELIQRLRADITSQRNYFPADLSAHNQLRTAKPNPVINNDWLSDIVDYAHHHQLLANNAINQLEPIYQSLFITLAITDYQRWNKFKSEVSVDNLAFKPSKLTINWRLWRASRLIKKPKQN